MIKISPIPQWRSFWRMWSLRFTTLGTILLSWISASPEIITSSWNLLPNEMKQYIPEQYLMYITITLFILGMVSRIVKQEKLSKADDGTN